MTRQFKIFAIASSLALGAFGCTAEMDGVGASEEALSAEVSAEESGCQGREGRGGPEGRRGHRGHHGPDFSELGVSEGQQAEIDAIRASTREQMQELRESGRSEEGREAMRAIREESRGLIEAVLSAEQLAELQAQHAERGAERSARHIARMTEELSLTPEQVTSIEAIMVPPADGARPDRSAHEATRAAVREVLTEEQQAKMEEMRGPRGEREHHGRRGHRGHHPRGEGPGAERPTLAI